MWSINILENQLTWMTFITTRDIIRGCNYTLDGIQHERNWELKNMNT